MKHTGDFNVIPTNEERPRNIMKKLIRPSSALICAVLTTLGLATAQAQTTANWIGPATGGEWNTGANWDTGFPPLDPTTNAFVGPGTNVDYNLPMTATSFGTLTLQGVLNVNTSGFNNTGMLLNKPAGGAKTAINANGIVNITGNFGIQSNANLTIAPGGTLIASGNLNIGSDLAGGSGGTTAGGGAYGNVTNNGGSITVAGTTFNPKNASLGSGNHPLLVINGGTNNLGDVDIHRPGATTQSALGTEGLIINAGQVNMTSLRLGDNNWATMFIGPGTIVTNTGAGLIRNATANRPSRLLQTGGYYVTTGTNTLTVSTGAGAGVTYSITGGTNYVAGFQIGDPAVLTSVGTANFTNAASIFVGAGGMASNGAAVVNISLNTGGRFAASADWTNTVPITLNGGSIDAKDETGAPHNIYSLGIFRGANALIKTGGGTLTLAGSNTYSGATFINNGTLALATDITSGSIGSLFSPTIIVGSGTTFDVSQVTGYSVNGLQTVSGSGAVIGPVTVASTGIINPGSNSVTGTLTFNNDLTETNGAVNHLDLPGDLINVLGTFNASGSNVVEVAGTLTSGTPYALIHYGTLVGDVSNFGLAGATGTFSNSVADKTIYLVVTSSLRANTNLTWVGNNVANDWDTHNLTNWVDGGVAPLDFFLSGDNVRFDNLGALHTNVNIPSSVSPGSIVVDSTSNYVFSGSGLIVGPSTLTKTNSGTLTILTTNSYSGITALNGGAVEVLSVANGGLPSPLGGSTADPSFLVFDGGSLRYSGDTVSTDRGATINANGGTIEVTNSATTLSVNGTLTGPGGYTKTGPGTLAVSAVNNYLGSTTISNGTLQVNGAPSALNGTVVFAGGTLSMNVGGQPTYPNPLNVATTGTLISGGGNNNIVTGPWSGSGTLNISIPSGTFTINDDMTPNFTGNIVISDTSAGSFRFNGGGNGNGAQQSTGSATASFDLGNSTAILLNRNGGALAFGVYSLGALSGGPSTFVRGASNGGGESNATYYAIGAKNLDTTYAGTIANGTGGAATALIKVGTGKLTLTGANTYTGLTVVSNGVLALGNGVTDGSIDGTTNIQISAGAILDVTGRSDGMLQQNGSQILSGSGTLRGTVNGFGTIAPGGGIGGGTGTLTVTNAANLFNVTWMKLNGASSDKLVSPTINLGGTLVVTNTGAPLHAGDTFTLFQGTLAGSFGTIILPNYYTFDTTQLSVNGTIKVVSYSPPTMTADYSAFSSGTITFNASNGIPGNAVSVLSSTNLSLPISNWTAVASGNFDGTGGFSAPVTVDTTVPSQFYILATQ